MKLRNKLIPIASCLAIGATVAPMATACTTSEFVDLKNGFTPTISRLAVEGYELEIAKAEQVYFNAVAGNSDILVQDLNWTMSLALRTAAENPNDLFGDSDTSILDYARQSIKNVKVGKTTIATQTETHDYYTVSFDLVREQQFTYKHEKEVITSQPTVKATTVGTTMYKLSFKNVPMGFMSYYHLFNSFVSENYGGHLGRGLFTNYNYKIRQYIPTSWFVRVNTRALENMVDPWEISYEYKTADTEYFTYNDVEHAEATGTHYEGKLNERMASANQSNSSSNGPSVYEEVINNTVIGSHYLSDIKVKEIE